MPCHFVEEAASWSSIENICPLDGEKALMWGGSS